MYKPSMVALCDIRKLQSGMIDEASQGRLTVSLLVAASHINLAGCLHPMSATATRQAPRLIQPLISKLVLIDPLGMCNALPMASEWPYIAPGASGVTSNTTGGDSSFVYDCFTSEGFDDVSSCAGGADKFRTFFANSLGVVG